MRVADPRPLFEPIGLLESVGEDDLLETDVYVFRMSTGELVMEIKDFANGPNGRESNGRNGVDVDGDAGYFEVSIPGRDATNRFRHIYRDREVHKTHEDGQPSLGVAESIQGREKDSLRVGEPLTIVVVNRATGYLGTASTSLDDLGPADITIRIPDMQLYPPNLKVHVERQYEVEHDLTAGKTRTYRVGSEGAALTSDQYLAVHTEWLDQDGRALPRELPGYTGRLASLTWSHKATAPSRTDPFGMCR